MKFIGFLVLLALIVGGYGYFFDHGLLKTVGLGSLVTADDAKAAAQQQESAPQASDTGALIKCVDSNGSITFTNHPCPSGQAAHKVKLSDTQIVHLGPGPNTNAPNQGGQNKDSDGHNQVVHSDKEPQKVNAKGALYEKFLPQ